MLIVLFLSLYAASICFLSFAFATLCHKQGKKSDGYGHNFYVKHLNVSKCQNRLPREVLLSPPLGEFKRCVDVASRDMA